MNLVNYVGRNHIPQDNTYEVYWVNPDYSMLCELSGISVGTQGGLTIYNMFAPGWNTMKQVPAVGAPHIKIRMLTEEDNTMGKRIGSYINPTTGEEDWLEPDTINMIVLQPRMVTKVGEVNQSSIEFKLDATSDENVINLNAEYTSNGQKYISKPIATSSEAFADELKDVIYSDKSLDESNLIKDAKDKACQDLTRRLMDNNILMGGMQFAGFGFVSVDGEKILTLESIDFDYRVDGNAGVYTAVLHNCVGQASLSNLESPEIKLWNGTHVVEIVQPNVTEAKEGRLKDYTITMSSIVVKPDTSMPEHKVYENPNFSNEDFLDQFINERRSLLDDVSGDDSDLDDRFDGLF